MRVLWVAVLLTFLCIAAEAKNGWQKGKGSWNKHKDGEDGYHKHTDGGNSNGSGGNGHGNGQGTNGNGSNGQGNGSNGNGQGNGQGTNGNGSNGQGNGQGTNGNGSNGQGNGSNGNGQGTNDNGNGKDPRPTPARTVSDIPEEAFHDLARQVIADDNFVAKYCEKNKLKGVTEIYSHGPDFYQLIIPIQDDDADYIEVKIKDRVIYIKAETPDLDPRWSGDDSHHIHYIKALPSFLDITRIKWDIKKLKLIVTIPYKFKFNSEQPVVCDVQRDVNAKEIVVPRGGIGRGPVNLIPQKDEAGATKKPIDPNVLDLIFARK